MRSGRQISLLLILQTRAGATAPDLAAELGVSQRTIYRDVEQLSEAGVPIYAERGNGGGIRLVDGYRTRLTGLDVAESEALSLAGWSTVAEALGVGSAAAGAERKLLAALSGPAAAKARKTQARIHFDLSRWYDASTAPIHLPALARAVWDQRRIHIDYSSWTSRKHRDIEPFGLVLKNATWYLVARSQGAMRTFRVSEIASLETIDGTFDVPATFDLRAYWESSKRRFEDGLMRDRATLRVTPRAEPLLARIGYAGARVTHDANDPSLIHVPIESLETAARDILTLGDSAEVVHPLELRARVASTVRAMAKRYRAPFAGTSTA